MTNLTYISTKHRDIKEIIRDIQEIVGGMDLATCARLGWPQFIKPIEGK